ncbi:MAG: hypothetical protein AB8G99_07265 [Planctomycetaceae bacterium]
MLDLSSANLQKSIFPDLPITFEITDISFKRIANLGWSSPAAK